MYLSVGDDFYLFYVISVVEPAECWVHEPGYFLKACVWLGFLQKAVVMVNHKFSSPPAEQTPSSRLAIR